MTVTRHSLSSKMMKEHEAKIRRKRERETHTVLPLDYNVMMILMLITYRVITIFFFRVCTSGENRSNVRTGFELIARGKLRLKDASHGVKAHDLRTSSLSDRRGLFRGPSSLPLFGHYCCRLAVQPPKFLEYSGFIRILDEGFSREGNVLRNAVPASSRENEQTKELEPNEVETRRRTSRKDHYDDHQERPRRSRKTFQEKSLCWASLQDFHLRLWILPKEVQEALQMEEEAKEIKTSFFSNNHENEEEEDLMMKERRDSKEEDSKRMKLPLQRRFSTRRRPREDRRVMMTVLGESVSLEPQVKQGNEDQMKTRCSPSSPSVLSSCLRPPSHQESNAASHASSFIQGILHFSPDVVIAINKNSRLTPMMTREEDVPDNCFLFSSTVVTSTLYSMRHNNERDEIKDESSVGSRQTNETRRRSSKTKRDNSRQFSTDFKQDDDEQTSFVMSSFSSSFRSSSTTNWMTQIEERMQDYLNWESTLESPMEILIPSCLTSTSSSLQTTMTSPSIVSKAISSPSKLQSSRYTLLDDDDFHCRSSTVLNTSFSTSPCSSSSRTSSSPRKNHRLLRPQGTTVGSLYDQTPSSWTTMKQKLYSNTEAKSTVIGCNIGIRKGFLNERNESRSWRTPTHPSNTLLS